MSQAPKQFVDNLVELWNAVDHKQSVTGNHGMFGIPPKPIPAAFIINMAGSVLLKMFCSGLWIYEKEQVGNAKSNEADTEEKSSEEDKTE